MALNTYNWDYRQAPLMANSNLLITSTTNCIFRGFKLKTQAEETKRCTRDQYFPKLFYNTQKEYKIPNTLPMLLCSKTEHLL